MRLPLSYALLGLTLLTLPAAAAFSADRPPIRRFVAAHHGAGRSAACTSPDGMYMAFCHVEQETGEGFLMLSVHKARPAEGHPRTAPDIAGGVDGFAWVPHRPHTLIFGSDGGHVGTGKLALWTPEKGERVLLHGHDLEDDNFDVKRLSTDGKTVIYEHFGYGVDERHPEHGSGPHHLMLPPF